MLLALTIISAVAGVICALDALGILSHRRTKTQTVEIVVNITASAAEPQPDRIIEEEPVA